MNKQRKIEKERNRERGKLERNKEINIKFRGCEKENRRNRES